MSRFKWLVALALSFERLQFGGHINRAVAVIANIKRYDTDRVAGNQKLVALLIVEHKRKDTAEVFEEVDAFLAIQCQNLRGSRCLSRDTMPE